MPTSKWFFSVSLKASAKAFSQQFSAMLDWMFRLLGAPKKLVWKNEISPDGGLEHETPMFDPESIVPRTDAFPNPKAQNRKIVRFIPISDVKVRFAGA